MHAIIRTGNGKYYTSAIFGSYIDGINRTWYKRYYIVLDESKTKLVNQPAFDPKKMPSLDQLVLIFDEDDTDWVYEDNGDGNVSFLSKKELKRYVRAGEVPQDTLCQCRKIDDSVTFQEIVEIQNERDIERLMMITGYFHDARIGQIEEKEDRTLSVLMVNCWGCNIRMEFSGDVAYCIDSRDPEWHDPYWFEASLQKKDEIYYFVDNAVEIEDINDDFCWFRAKNIKYQIILN